jgi:hypothetical protein
MMTRLMVGLKVDDGTEDTAFETTATEFGVPSHLPS